VRGIRRAVEPTPISSWSGAATSAGECRENEIGNYGESRVLPVELLIGADFADLFRGQEGPCPKQAAFSGERRQRPHHVHYERSSFTVRHTSISP